MSAVRSGSTISVPDVVYGGYTTATVSTRHASAPTYVFVQCYVAGEYVFAAYYPVDGSNQAVLGPLASSLWPSGPADCTATEGWFTKQGLGQWRVLAATTFKVNP